MVLNIKYRRGRQSSRAIRAQAGRQEALGRSLARSLAAVAGRGEVGKGCAARRGGSVSIPRRLQSASVERRAAPTGAGERASPLPRARPRPATASAHRHLSTTPANSNDLFSLTNVAPASGSRRETALDLYAAHRYCLSNFMTIFQKVYLV